MRKADELISAHEARALLSYEPETGLLRWKVRRSPKTAAGAVAGSTRKGYMRVRVEGIEYQAHRIAWLIHFGTWPREFIDHINGVRSDNRLCNLRECSHPENMQNVPKLPGKYSKYLGVTFHIQKKRWISRISTLGKRRDLGYFDTEEDAYEAYCKAKKVDHAFSPVPRIPVRREGPRE